MITTLTKLISLLNNVYSNDSHLPLSKHSSFTIAFLHRNTISCKFDALQSYFMRDTPYEYIYTLYIHIIKIT